jgi:predicted nucleic acid-binding protein
MKQVFVDTSAFAALADKNDGNHSRAVAFNKTISGIRLVTTNYVLDELYTLLLLHADYSKTVQFKHRLDFLITRKALTVIWITPEIATQTWQIFEQFNTDKQWSFTDCTSYVVMKDQGITEAFTFDHHFSQMGFIRRPD